MSLEISNNIENHCAENPPWSSASARGLERPRKNKPRKVLAEERKRAVRACDRCRKLKEKCEGGAPCRRCLYYSNICEFNGVDIQEPDGSTNAKRPRISKAHVSELSRRCFYMEQILKVKCPETSLDTDNLRRAYEALPQREDDLDNHRDFDLEDEDELALDEEVCTIDPVQENVTHYSGEFSYWNFSMRLKRQIDDRISATMFRNPTHESEEISGYWRAEKLQSGLSNLATVISCFPPRHVADSLVEVFFEYAQTNYFLVDKTWLLEKIRMLYLESHNCFTKDAPAIGIVLTVFAIGTQYVYLDSKQKSRRSKSMLTYSEDEVGRMFYQQAIKLLPEIIELSSLESVQACLLFGIYTLPLDASGLAYIYLNLTIRLAMQNGMHRRYTGNALSPITIETRNRVWWSAYTLDRKINIFHGRPLSLARYDVETNIPVILESHGESCILSTTIYMTASIKLAHYLEDFLHHMTSLRTLPKQDISRTLSSLMDTKSNLTTWWQSLPNATLNPDISQGASYWRAAMHVRLEYCLVRLFVGRPFLLQRSRSRPYSEMSPESQSTNYTNGTPENRQKSASRRLDLVNDCVQAALEALDICQSLSDNTPGLARASYIEYSSCRASLLVLIACSIQDETDQFHNALQRGLDMIYEMSAAGDSARSEVSLIESLERSVCRLKLVYKQTLNHNPASSSAGRYDFFKCWESMWQMTNSNRNNGNTHFSDGDPRRVAAPPSEQSRSPAHFLAHSNQVLPDGLPNVDEENCLSDTHTTVPNDGEIDTLDLFGSAYSAMDLGLFWEHYQ